MRVPRLAGTRIRLASEPAQKSIQCLEQEKPANLVKHLHLQPHESLCFFPSRRHRATSTASHCIPGRTYYVCSLNLCTSPTRLSGVMKPELAPAERRRGNDDAALLAANRGRGVEGREVNAGAGDRLCGDFIKAEGEGAAGVDAGERDLDHRARRQIIRRCREQRDLTNPKNVWSAGKRASKRNNWNVHIQKRAIV
ncbi:hypothetical protein MKEN_00382800 [Mycena kentingensis (nom. inval.)]|nr:hypothetical protein MKEN_00382800 [Mycena kentingensis (nom. inval.)]